MSNKSPVDEYITNFKFVEYVINNLPDEADKFMRRFYGTNAFWTISNGCYQIGGSKENVNIFVDYLWEEFNILPKRVLYGTAGMEALMKC